MAETPELYRLQSTKSLELSLLIQLAVGVSGYLRDNGTPDRARHIENIARELERRYDSPSPERTGSRASTGHTEGGDG